MLDSRAFTMIFFKTPLESMFFGLATPLLYGCMFNTFMYLQQVRAYKKPHDPKDLFEGTKKSKKNSSHKGGDKSSSSDATEISKSSKPPPKYDYTKHPVYVSPRLFVSTQLFVYTFIVEKPVLYLG